MNTANHDEGIMFAFEILGDGKGRPLDWQDIAQGWQNDSLYWVHLNYRNARAREWLQNESQIDESLIPYLISEETRPGAFVHEDHLLMILRGINLNTSEEPEDLVSIRFYISPRHLLSLRKRKVHILEEISQELLQGKGIRNAAQFVYEVVARVVSRIGTHVDSIDRAVADLEQTLLNSNAADIGDELQRIQSKLIDLRRFLSPQKTMFATLIEEDIEWMDSKTHNRLRTQVELHTRFVEDLDYCWQRTQVIKEELTNRQNERLNQKLYLLAMVSCVFLPLTLLTGLLGVNLAGIPFADRPYAFGLLSLLLLILFGLILFYFKRKRWF